MAKSSKLSKMAANRLAVTTTVVSSATVHGAEVAQTLHALLFPTGNAKPELTHKFMAALSQTLDRAALEVQEADLSHATELLDDEEPRQRRDAAQADLLATLLGQRDTLAALYGPETVRCYGLAEAMPTAAPQLLQRARVVRSLYEQQPTLPKPLRAGVTVRCQMLADELGALIQRFETALGDVQRESREAQLTQERKTLAAERWHDTYQGVTYAFYGLYLLAGRRDLAERIEPTARRRAGLTEEPDQPPAAADPSPPASPSANHPEET